jgi:hypothetical protein
LLLGSSFSQNKKRGHTSILFGGAELAEAPMLGPEGQMQLVINMPAERATVMVLDPAGENVIFAGEDVGEVLLPSQQGRKALEDTWRIDHTQLKCRRQANGELVKLGEGENNLSLPIPPIPSHPTPPHPPPRCSFFPKLRLRLCYRWTIF